MRIEGREQQLIYVRRSCGEHLGRRALYLRMRMRHSVFRYSWVTAGAGCGLSDGHLRADRTDALFTVCQLHLLDGWNML